MPWLCTRVGMLSCRTACRETSSQQAHTMTCSTRPASLPDSACVLCSKHILVVALLWTCKLSSASGCPFQTRRLHPCLYS